MEKSEEGENTDLFEDTFALLEQDTSNEEKLMEPTTTTTTTQTTHQNQAKSSSQNDELAHMAQLLAFQEQQATETSQLVQGESNFRDTIQVVVDQFTGLSAVLQFQILQSLFQAYKQQLPEQISIPTTTTSTTITSRNINDNNSHPVQKKKDILEATSISSDFTIQNINIVSCFPSHFATFRNQSYGIHSIGRNVEVKIPANKLIKSCCLALKLHNGTYQPIPGATINRKISGASLIVKLPATKRELAKLINQCNSAINISEYIPDNHPHEVKGCFGPFSVIFETFESEWCCSTIFFISTHNPKKNKK